MRVVTAGYTRALSIGFRVLAHCQAENEMVYILTHESSANKRVQFSLAMKDEVSEEKEGEPSA
jgi:hypothetical protein